MNISLSSVQRKNPRDRHQKGHGATTDKYASSSWAARIGTTIYRRIIGVDVYYCPNQIIRLIPALNRLIQSGNDS